MDSSKPVELPEAQPPPPPDTARVALESADSSQRNALASEVMRLEDELGRERSRLLQAERRRLRAEGKLERLQARRWWKIGTVLSEWRRRPYRIDVLAVGMWRALTRREQLPPMPETGDIEQEFGAGGEHVEGWRQQFALARLAFAENDYEGCLEVVAGLPAEFRQTHEALRLVRDCHIKMGEVSKALATIKWARSVDDTKALQRQQRILEGRLRETHTAWLPSVAASVPKGWAPENGRVLHILKESLPFFERGYTMRSQATLLAQRMAGYEPTVVTSLGFPRSQGFDDFPASELIDGIPHHRLDLGPEYEPRRIPYDQILSDQATLTAQIATGVAPSFVQAGSGYRGYETALVGLAVARRLDVPLVYEIRSFLEQTWTSEIARSETGEYYERRYAQETRCLMEADQVVTIAEAMRAEIVARGVPGEKIAVVPNVVDVERFRPRPKRGDLIDEYGLAGRSVLGYVSNLGSREGIDNLIRAVALLRGEGLDVAGLVVGDGPMKASLDQLVDDMDLRGSFILTGHIPNEDIEDHYALIDLFVVPRVDDRAARLVTPLKPLEAMAMEIPVIASDLPALRELASPGQRGEVFEPGSPDSLARVAGTVLGSQATQQRMVARAKEWILAERTLESNSVRYREILDSLVGGSA